jgi:hypothetical protein
MYGAFLHPGRWRGTGTAVKTLHLLLLEEVPGAWLLLASTAHACLSVNGIPPWRMEMRRARRIRCFAGHKKNLSQEIRWHWHSQNPGVP